MNVTLALVRAIRRAAAMPAAPAPMTAISTWPLIGAAAMAGAPTDAAEAADAARNRRRLSTLMMNRRLTHRYNVATGYGWQIATQIRVCS
jgi:hypothetical protein